MTPLYTHILVEAFLTQKLQYYIVCVCKELLKLQVSTERRGFTFPLENNLKLHKESFLPVDINLKHLKKNTIDITRQVRIKLTRSQSLALHDGNGLGL